jgi:hypothetical protein
LDLLDFLPSTGASVEELEEEKQNLRLKIWARSVLRDQWTNLGTDDPINVIAETVFFKLVNFFSNYYCLFDDFVNVPPYYRSCFTLLL